MSHSYLELARCRAAKITLCIESPEAGHPKGRVGSRVLRLTMAFCFQELKTALALPPAHKHEDCTMWPFEKLGFQFGVKPPMI